MSGLRGSTGLRGTIKGQSSNPMLSTVTAPLIDRLYRFPFPKAPGQTYAVWSFVVPNNRNILPYRAAALDYYRYGYLPIPLPPGAKHPPPKGTPNDIEINAAQIRRWARERPNANIATVVPDGVIVIDVDGPEGVKTLDKLERNYGELPPTWKVSRGDPDRFHMWFCSRSGLAWPGDLGQGIDIIYRHYRYVLLPPSVHPNGSAYYWIRPDGSKADFGEFPSWTMN